MFYTLITSRKNSLMIETSLLSDKKHRDKANLFCADGIKLLEEALNSKLEISRIFFTQNALDNYAGLLANAPCNEKYLVTDEVFQKLTDEKSPQGILTCIKKPQLSCPDDNQILDGGFVILDCLQNPLNLGAILRCAYSLGSNKIVLTPGCADPFGQKAVRAAMGSLFKVQLYNVSSTLEFCKTLQVKNNRVLCTSLTGNAKKIGQFEFKKTDSIIIGNEGHGVDETTASMCSERLFIPMIPDAESLNAATAAAITLWEMNKSVLFD